MNSKNNAFTLIELLAVIVIMGVIMTIAIPAVNSLIEKSKVGAMKTSASGILEAAKLYASNEMKNNEQKVVFTIKDGNQTSTNGDTLKYDGKIENGTIIAYSDGKLATCIDNETLYAKKNTTTNEISVGTGTCGEAINNDTDFNVLSTVEALQKQVDDLKQELDEKNTQIINNSKELSDDKTSLATAITNKGVTTSPTDSFTTIINNISNIDTKGYTDLGVLTYYTNDTGGNRPAYYDLKGYANYKNITKANIIVMPQTLNATNAGNIYIGSWHGLGIDYIPETGVLTVYGIGVTNYAWGVYFTTARVIILE